MRKRRGNEIQILTAQGRRMKPNPIIGDVRWERFPTVAALREARDWLKFQACRGLALNTLDAYGRNLERYLRFVARSGKMPWEVKQDTVGAYLNSFVSTAAKEVDGGNRTVANATVQQHLATLRMFHDFLVEEEYCARNPFRKGQGAWSRPLIKREHKLPWIPSEEEWCCFLAAASEEPIRNKTMLAMSYDAGLRREELCLLETADIDPSRRTLRIRAETTKNRRSRVLPYSATTGELFAAYLNERRALSRARGRLFLSQSRRNRSAPLSIWTWSKVVKSIARRAGLNGFSPHTLRHLCLTDLARADWDIHEIATFAGHRNIETTMIYVHLSARDLAAKFNSTMAQVHERRLEVISRLFR